MWIMWTICSCINLFSTALRFIVFYFILNLFFLLLAADCFFRALLVVLLHFINSLCKIDAPTDTASRTMLSTQCIFISKLKWHRRKIKSVCCLWRFIFDVKMLYMYMSLVLYYPNQAIDIVKEILGFFFCSISLCF